MRRSLDKEQKKRIGNLIRERLTKNAIENSRNGKRTLIGSAKELASEAHVTDSVIYRMHSGEFSNRTLQMVESILGVDFLSLDEASDPSANGAAGGMFRSDHWEGAIPVRFGGYSKEQMLPYLSRYITVRRVVTAPTHFLGSVLKIYWDDRLGAARFFDDNKFEDEDDRNADYSQGGTVHMSAETGVIHLLTSWKGALRLITLTRLQIDKVIYGAMLTQVSDAGHYMPAKTTIHFRKLDPENEAAANRLRGLIRPGHPEYENVARDLDRADRAIYTR